MLLRSRLSSEVAQQNMASVCPCSVCQGRKHVSLKVRKRHIDKLGLSSVDDDIQFDERNESVKVKQARKMPQTERESLIRPSSSKSSDPTVPILPDVDTTSNNISFDEGSAGEDIGAEFVNGDVDAASEQDIVDERVMCETANDEEVDDLSDSHFEFDDDEEDVAPAKFFRTENELELKEKVFEASDYSVKQLIAAEFLWFSGNAGISKESLSQQLKLKKQLLPQPNLVPASYEDAYNLIKGFLVKAVSYDVCQNDCIIYREEYAHAESCPICKSERLQAGKTRRKFTYIPLKERVIRLFSSKKLSALIQSHATVNSSLDDQIRDTHDTQRWKDLYAKDGYFAGDARGLSFVFSTDGVDPFKKTSKSKSMWPMSVAIINFPRHLRFLFSTILLTAIIPSNNGKEPLSLQPYIRVVVDELLALNGLRVYDAYKDEAFILRTFMFTHILDYPGINKVFNTQGSGAYRGCCWCKLKGTSCCNCKKIVWPGNRRYLSPNDPLRQDDDFIDKEMQQQPEKNSMAELRNYRKAYDNAERAVDREQVSSASGCKASYSFMQLPYHDFMADVQPDGMHTVSNVIKTLIKLLSNLYQIAMTSVLEDEKNFKNVERCSYIVSALKDQESTTTGKSKRSGFKKPCKAQSLPYTARTRPFY